MRAWPKYVILVLALVPLFLAGRTVFGADLYISRQGNDANPGTQQQPFATLAAARDAIRQSREVADYAPQPTTVWIGGGNYFLPEGFHLEERDSGTSEAPVVYAALEHEVVRLQGGVALSGWKPVANQTQKAQFSKEAQPHVVVTNLPEQGLTDYGTLEPRGWSCAMAPAPLELFQGARALPLAGWPNDSWAKASEVNEQRQFVVPQEQALGMKQATDAWVHGFWSFDYADSFVPVSQYDHQSRTITLPKSEDLAQLRPNSRYRLLNVLAELDSPGEWYLDRETGDLYLWPAESLQDSPVVASQVETVVSVYEASYVSFRNLTIEASRVMGVEVAGGSDVHLVGCTIRNTGNLGVHLYFGNQHVVQGCEIYNTGEGAVRVEGGDRLTLEESDHLIHQNHLHHYARNSVAFRPAVDVYGVGTTLSNNEISAGGGPGIVLQGNEHLVEKNNIHDVCQLAADVGAIYLGHDPTYRGNVIRHNHVHDLGGFSQNEVIAIYLDDLASGTKVYGNMIVHAGRAVAVGGGSDNEIQNNVIVDCVTGVQIDNRGQTWAKHRVTGENSFVAQCCEAVKHTQEPYASRYPALSTMLKDEVQLAKGNSVACNLISSPHGIALHYGLNRNSVSLSKNLSLNGPAALEQWFVDSTGGDWRLKEKTPAGKIGFVALPWGEIGLPLNPQTIVVATLP